MSPPDPLDRQTLPPYASKDIRHDTNIELSNDDVIQLRLNKREHPALPYPKFSASSIQIAYAKHVEVRRSSHTLEARSYCRVSVRHVQTHLRRLSQTPKKRQTIRGNNPLDQQYFRLCHFLI